jgi:hypothetical protein
MQGAVALFAPSFHEVGKTDFSSLVRFFQLRPRRQVITVAIAGAVTVLGRKGAIGDVRVGWVNAKGRQHQNCYRSTAKKPAHRFPRPENGRDHNCIEVATVQSNKLRGVGLVGQRKALLR